MEQSTANVLKVTKEVVDRYLLLVPQGQRQTSLITWLLSIQTSMVPAAITSTEASLLWDTVRSADNDVLTNFILRGSSELYFKMGWTQAEYQVFCKMFASAISPIGPMYRDDTNAVSLIDDTLKSRIERLDQLEAMLYGNKWLVFILLISMMPPIMRVNTTVEPTEE